jgi:outer membrane receptor protein involved in Fe transport
MKSEYIPRIGLALLILINLAWAGITGKIAGTVTDANTKAPLPGANIVIEGTGIGCATDINGYFTILNLAPGKYTLKVTMIGYQNVTMKDVQVEMNLTTNVDVKMNTEVLGMQEVVVEARRPVVVKDVAHSQLTVDGKTISNMPVVELTQVVGLQAGVDGFSVRGGAERQTALIIDGFVQNDARANNPIKSVSLTSVKEVQVQAGGFNAEYGNVRSGVVNVVTDDGRKDRYSGTFSVLYRPAGPKHFGISPYDKYSYFNRPYFDPAVCFVGTANGSWDNWTRSQYPTFEGYNALSLATMQDNDPNNDLTPTAVQRLYEWQHRRQGDIKKSDYVIDFALGGPVPVLNKYLGNLRFYFSQNSLRDMLIVPLSREAYTSDYSRLKLTADISPKTVLTMTGMYNVVKSASPYEWTTTPTGDILRSDYTIASSTSSTKELLYVPGRYSPADIYYRMIGAKINHVISPKSYFDFLIQYNFNRYNTFQMALRDTSKKYEIVDGYYVDEAPYGYWGYGVSSVEGLRIGGWMNLGRDKSKSSTLLTRFDYTNQVNSNHQIKSGFEIQADELNVRSSTENPGMSTWCRSQIYDVYPYRAGVYFADKMEYEGFVANLSLRADLYNPNTDVYLLSDYDKYYRSGYGSLIEEEVPTKKTKVQYYLSPRLAVSHPITENSKLYFNYGHYLSEAASTYRFRLQREYNGLVTYIGNPELRPERTISYELGYQHNLFGNTLLTLAAYYKDITDQIGWVYYQNINASVQYYKATNSNYADIRGFEITLDKKRGTWFTGFVNYTYMVTSSGYFGIQRYYQDPSSQRVYLMDNPTQEKPAPQPYARANLDFHTPLNYGPAINRLYLLGGWNLNLLATWRQGSYATYNPTNIPGLINNVQWVDSWNFDARITKTFDFKGLAIQTYVEVTNLFNLKYLSYAGFVSNQDYLNYLASLHFDWEEGTQKGNDRIGVYRHRGVDYIPMQEVADITGLTSIDPRVLYYDQATATYYQLENNQLITRSKSWVKKNVLDTKAYIDMPNNTSFTFLYPREIKFGVKINF